MMATGVPTKLCNHLFFFFFSHFVFQLLRSFIKTPCLVGNLADLHNAAGCHGMVWLSLRKDQSPPYSSLDFRQQTHQHSPGQNHETCSAQAGHAGQPASPADTSFVEPWFGNWGGQTHFWMLKAARSLHSSPRFSFLPGFTSPFLPKVFQGDTTAMNPLCPHTKHLWRVSLAMGLPPALRFSSSNPRIKVEAWPSPGTGSSGRIPGIVPRGERGRRPGQDGKLQCPSYKKCWKPSVWRSWNQNSEKVLDHKSLSKLWVWAGKSWWRAAIGMSHCKWNLFSLEQASPTGTMAGMDILQGTILFHLERLRHLEIFSDGNDILLLLINTASILLWPFPLQQEGSMEAHGESHPTITSRGMESHPSSPHRHSSWKHPFECGKWRARHPVGCVLDWGAWGKANKRGKNQYWNVT